MAAALISSLPHPHPHPLLLIIFFFILISSIVAALASSSSFDDSLIHEDDRDGGGLVSVSVSVEQLAFLSRNVAGEVPPAILTKLSPMTAHDSARYALNPDLMTPGPGDHDANNNNNDDFCSLAHLACASAFHDSAKTVTNTYTTTKTYATPRAAALNSNNKVKEDPFSFFRRSLLKSGNRIRLPDLHESLPDRSFLPFPLASRIPLNYSALLRIFPALSSESSINLDALVRNTLAYCSAPQIAGETKSCPTSLEELVGFAKSSLLGNGNLGKIVGLASKNMDAKGLGDEVVVGEVKEYEGVDNKIVACHEAFLPFAAYFCHSLSSTKLYGVEILVVDDAAGEIMKKASKSTSAIDNTTAAAAATMLAICHMDTSAWPKDHVAFKILKTGAGQGEACHWFTMLDVAWIAAH
ncbi:BURP domain-containing protein 16-like [Andrographis paniculata]|uniref:BURP domain-containing protein 16-like n=1 Tax=Andrographis paniculata TaxID=175694 RepID=UPI0021E9AB95|nr:BURP domain-containing protein 16-like [Andrographis paniculata]